MRMENGPRHLCAASIIVIGPSSMQRSTDSSAPVLVARKNNTASGVTTSADKQNKDRKF
ncbi:hypothetical protein NHJ13051_008204 [Beauveria bassiana]